MNVSMIISSCDKYDDAWSPFCTQLLKNWPSFDIPIYLNTELKAFSFEGLDIRCPFAGKNIKFKQWSDRLLKLLDFIPDEYVLFMLDDFWLTESVDTDAYMKIVSYMEQNPRMGYVCLKQELKEYSSDKDKQSCMNCEYPELWRCGSGKSFRITTQAGLWKKSYLSKLLRSHESVWYFETRATKRSRFYFEKVYDVKKNIFTYPIGGFFGGGQCYADYLNLYPKEVTKACIEKRGVIHFGDHRDYPPTPKGLAYYWSLIKSAMPKF